MKKTIFISLFLIALNIPLFAQFESGCIELGGSLGFYLMNESIKNGNHEDENDASLFICSINPAIYVVKGLSIEPEIGLMLVENEKPGIFLLGNVSYTYLIPDKSIAPYAKIGFGATNSLAIPNVNLYSKASEDLDITIFNLAGGVKFLINKTAIIKTELNYRKFSYSEDLYFSKIDYSRDFVSILLGISFVLN